jgi:hemerythrin
MSLFAWKDGYGIGVPEIDAQHRRLFALADELHEALNKGKGKEVLQEVLKKLVDYTQTHFASEERLMHRCGYPDILAHKAQHEEFVRKASLLEREFQAGKTMLSIEVMQFVSNWLRQHIGGSDRRFAPFVLGKAVA